MYCIAVRLSADYLEQTLYLPFIGDCNRSRESGLVLERHDKPFSYDLSSCIASAVRCNYGYRGDDWDENCRVIQDGVSYLYATVACGWFVEVEHTQLHSFSLYVARTFRLFATGAAAKPTGLK